MFPIRESLFYISYSSQVLTDFRNYDRSVKEGTQFMFAIFYAYFLYILFITVNIKVRWVWRIQKQSNSRLYLHICEPINFFVFKYHHNNLSVYEADKLEFSIGMFFRIIDQNSVNLCIVFNWVSTAKIMVKVLQTLVILSWRRRLF